MISGDIRHDQHWIKPVVNQGAQGRGYTPIAHEVSRSTSRQEQVFPCLICRDWAPGSMLPAVVFAAASDVRSKDRTQLWR